MLGSRESLDARRGDLDRDVRDVTSSRRNICEANHDPELAYSMEQQPAPSHTMQRIDAAEGRGQRQQHLLPRRGAARRVPPRPAFATPMPMHFFRSLYSFLVFKEATNFSEPEKKDNMFAQQ